MKHLKPRVVSSKCIEFEYCRYNGNIISSDIVKEMKNYITFIPVCPEVEIGLGVPRDPIRIIQDKDDSLSLVQSSTGRNITDLMNIFAQNFLDSIGDIDGFILKSKSPSCGTSHTPYLASTQKGAAKLGRGPGLFGKNVLDKYTLLPIENEGRLTNFRIREHFLTKLYLTRSFKELKSSKSIHELTQFHAHNKFLLMAHNQQLMREMGKIAANQEKDSLEDIFDKYESVFYQAIRYPPKYTSNINVLMHILGFFSKNLTKEEKAYFLDELEKYRSGWIPLFVLIRLLKSWIIRFNQTYLRDQSFFNPYPEELMLFDLKDTWRGRNYWIKKDEI